MKWPIDEGFGTPDEPTRQAYYWLGQRDMLAQVLSSTDKKIRLPQLADLYTKVAGEDHFSLAWHKGDK